MRRDLIIPLWTSTLTVFIVKVIYTCGNAYKSLCIEYLSSTHQLHSITTVLHMEYPNNKTNNEVPCDNNLIQNRLTTSFAFLRLGGIPLKILTRSNVQIVYNIFCVVCYYFTMVCSMLDTYAHRYDLVQVMKKTRINLAFLIFAWMHFSLRYDTHYYQRV